MVPDFQPLISPTWLLFLGRANKPGYQATRQSSIAHLSIVSQNASNYCRMLEKKIYYFYYQHSSSSTVIEISCFSKSHGDRGTIIDSMMEKNKDQYRCTTSVIDTQCLSHKLAALTYQFSLKLTKVLNAKYLNQKNWAMNLNPTLCSLEGVRSSWNHSWLKLYITKKLNIINIPQIWNDLE